MTNIEFLRQFKFSGYAIFDLTVSFLGTYLLSPLLIALFRKIKISTTKSSWLLLTLSLSLIFHLLFNQQTQMVKDFMSPTSHYFLKFIVILSTYLGLKSIKKINS